MIRSDESFDIKFDEKRGVGVWEGFVVEVNCV
jgi:hypothetical protein